MKNLSQLWKTKTNQAQNFSQVSLFYQKITPETSGVIFIDFTTMALPVSDSISVDFGYGYVVNLRRVGNVVSTTSWAAFTSKPVDGQEFSNRIPLGYRPIYQQNLPRAYSDGTTNGRSTSWRVSSNGAVKIYSTANSGDTMLYVASYLTNDPWPTS